MHLRLHDCLITSSMDDFQHFLNTHPYSSIQVLSDHHVFALHGEKLMQLLDRQGRTLVSPMLFPAGEPFKNLATAESCWAHMHAKGVDRQSLLIGLGGGAVTDLSGFVASCYMRGIDAVFIPTTLMGMVDAAIGGKSGVNLPTGKNVIGSFFHPKLILIDPDYLSTLSQRELRSGLAEVIKYGVIWDPVLFEYLEEHMEQIFEGPHLDYILRRSCAIKSHIVQEDEKDRGLRAILNFGHTFAHALETATRYETYLHGEVVAIGMCCAGYASLKLGLVDKGFVERLLNLCKRAGLPTQLPRELSVDQLVALMASDKKAVGGMVSLIVAHKIGAAGVIKEVDPAILKASLENVK